MVICKALVKHGYSNFSLEIIEYCNRSDVISREQYYLDLCKPEYNVAKFAGEGRHSRIGEQLAKRLVHLKLHNASVEQVEKSRQRLIAYNKSRGMSIEILDTTTDEISSYSSIREAAEALGCVHGTIIKAVNNKREGINKVFKKKYLVKSILRGYHSST